MSTADPPPNAPPTPPPNTPPGATPNSAPLSPPADPQLVRALEAFELGRFEQSWAALDAVESPQGDDRVYAERLTTARALDPALYITLAAGLAWWLYVFMTVTD